eukprot:4751350-Pleurochrysis_carterae.AAC.2
MSMRTHRSAGSRHNAFALKATNFKQPALFKPFASEKVSRARVLLAASRTLAVLLHGLTSTSEAKDAAFVAGRVRETSEKYGFNDSPTMRSTESGRGQQAGWNKRMQRQWVDCRAQTINE